MAPDRDTGGGRGEDQPGGVYPVYPGTSPGTRRPPGTPLTQRLRPGHWIAIDYAVGGFAALIAVFITALGPVRTPAAGRAMFLVDLLIAAAVFLPVALRRRAPALAYGWLIIFGSMLATVDGNEATLVFLAAGYVLYMVTVASERRRTGAAALVLGLGVLVIAAVFEHQAHRPGGAAFVPVAFAMVIAWIIAYSVRQRRLYIVTLQQQAAASAVTGERLRIARELHDVVAHSMSVIAVQAGYGQYVIDVNPDDAREALGAIQATSRDALDEMRRMLGVLRQQDTAPPPGTVAAPGDSARQVVAAAAHARVEDRAAVPPDGNASGAASTGAAPLAPAPGLADLDRLIQRTGGAGIQVRLVTFGHARLVPAGVDLSAYRIIQEALTNVVKHAGTGAGCTVSVSYTDADLVIRVTDDGGGRTSPAVTPGLPDARGIVAAGAGHGIIGMRERVALCGGRFSAGPLSDGGFEVSASLPLPATGMPADSFASPRSPQVADGPETAGLAALVTTGPSSGTASGRDGGQA